ncbi:MAG: carbohydrate ABC transporter permease [Cetobacterium sp.]|nr:carbohydrate ABC transporter permease [Cetobacterium sp.]
MKIKKEDILYYITVGVFLLFTLGPIFWCFIISISPEKEMLNSSTNLFPKTITLENYKKLLTDDNFYLALKNSLITAGVTIFLGLPVSIMSGYSFSRLKFKGRKFLEVLILTTIVIPLFTTIIPLYTIFANLGMLDNIFWVSIIYVSSFLPMVTWIMTNYFKGIPKEIEEMALIDGCGRIKILFYIILPNTYPIILASILIIFLMSWSQYQIPLILASSRATKPLSILIAEFTSKDMINYGLMASGGILAVLPPSIFAIIFRKYLVTGLTKGAVTGE